MKKRFLEVALVLTMMCTAVFGCANNGAKEAGVEVSAEAGAEGSSSENAAAGRKFSIPVRTSAAKRNRKLIDFFMIFIL